MTAGTLKEVPEDIEVSITGEPLLAPAKYFSFTIWIILLITFLNVPAVIGVYYLANCITSTKSYKTEQSDEAAEVEKQ